MVRRYSIVFVIDNGDDVHAPGAIIDALDNLRARGTFTDALIAEMEATACCVCLVQDIEIIPPDDAPEVEAP